MGSEQPKRSSDPPQTEALFRLDINGDRQNLAYESLHRTSIPKYRTAGHGNAIGLSRGFKVTRFSDSRRQVVVQGLDSAIRPRQSILPLSPPEPSQLVRGGQLQTTEIASQQDYVDVGKGFSRKRRRLLADIEGSSSEESSSEATEQTCHPSDSLSTSVATQDETLRRQRGLLEKTAKQPNDIDAWTALIELQREIVQPSGIQVTATEARVIADLRISVYREALSKVTAAKSRHILTVGLMKEGSNFWDIGKQLSEWRAIMTGQPPVELSVLYLDFLQSNASAFSYDHCVQEYQKCLTAQTNRPRDLRRDYGSLYIVLRLTTFMRQCGFVERAVALWQGLVESNLLQPGFSTFAAAAASFEEFWDSETRRFGELEAKSGKDKNDQYTASQEESSMPIDSKNLYYSWSLAETAAAQACLPARTLDHASIDDPYRLILYSDIKDFLFDLCDIKSVAYMLDAMLCFLGLPSISGSPAVYVWRTDPFLYPPIHSLPPRTSDCSLRTMAFSGLSDVTSLFAPPGLFGAFQGLDTKTRLSQFTLNAVETLATSMRDSEDLGVYAIALNLQFDLKAARKLSKRLIKQNSSCLRLYNAYALTEARSGNIEIADNVWQTTLKMNSSSKDVSQLDILQLWESWSLEKLLQEKSHEALGILSRFPFDYRGFDTTGRTDVVINEALLEAERALQTNVNQQLAPQLAEGLAVTTHLLAMLRYCRGKRDLGAAIETFRTILDLLTNLDPTDSSTGLVESLHQRQAYLIHIHVSTTKTPFEPKQVLMVLARSVSAFPNNSIFLTLYDQYQRRYGFTERIRSIAHDALSDTPDIFMSYVHDIQRELSSSIELGTTEHSTRAAFTNANHEDSPAQNCPSIRLAHVQWELNILKRRSEQYSTDSKRRRKATLIATEALYSALRACPWVKEIYMAAFENEILRDALRPSGLKGLYETMLERGLRIHVDISDKIEAAI